jgi:hypothetical protein
MPLRFYRSFRRGGRVGIVGQVIIALRRVEFKSKAVVHFDQHAAAATTPLNHIKVDPCGSRRSGIRPHQCCKAPDEAISSKVEIDAHLS